MTSTSTFNNTMSTRYLDRSILLDIVLDYIVLLTDSKVSDNLTADKLDKARKLLKELG